MTNSAKYLCYLTIYCLILFTLVPLLRVSLPMDTQEAMVWGKYCLWGTTKHPPFSGWLAYDFYRLLFSWDGALYLLSQLCVACGIFYIYKLARNFLDADKAAIAAMLQFGIIYYNFSAVEFNVNVVSVALWPMCAYYFWQAYTKDKLADWLIFGLLAGINILNKYVSSLLFASLAIFAVADKNLWKLMKNMKVYLAVSVALTVIAPHLWWMYSTDFETLNYFASRSGKSSFPIIGHLLYPLKFLLAQILFSAAMLLTYFIFYRKAEKDETVIDKSGKLFITVMAFAPLGLFALTAIISGHSLKSMWGFPCLFMWGTALVYFYPIKSTTKLPIVMAGWVTLFAFAYALQCMLTTSQRFTTDVRGLTANVEHEWHNFTSRPLEYVGSTEWYADMVALYGSHEIKPMVWMEPTSNPWFDAEDFKRKGALVIANDEAEYNRYKQIYGDEITEPRKMTVEFKNYFAKTKVKEILYGFYLPKEKFDAE